MESDGKGNRTRPRIRRKAAGILLAIAAAGALGTFTALSFMRPEAAEETAPVESDRAGKGTDVTFERVDLGGDWRNAAVVSPGGFFYEKTDVKEGDVLRFSAAGEKTTSVLSVTAVPEAKTGAPSVLLWRKKAAELTSGRWTDVALPLALAGTVQFVFESEGPRGSGAAYFANYRVETTLRGAAAEGRAAPGPRSRNVILVVADALRPDRMSLYGYSKPTTPRIDAAARGAAVFEGCLAQAPWTMPAVATLFTSLYPSAHGLEAFEQSMPKNCVTLAGVFQKAGWRTVAIQSNASLEPKRGWAQGFDEYKLFHLRKPTIGDASLYAPASVVVDSALSWVAENAGPPFFMYMHFMETHSPYVSPPEFADFGGPGTEPYDRSIAYFDAEFGKFLAALEARGLLETTTVVLTADHGEQFYEHGSNEHANGLHIEELRVPLVVWSPEVKTGVRVKGWLGAIDIPATLVALAGLDAPAAWEGRTFAPSLSGAPVEDREVYGELLSYQFAGLKLVSVTKGNLRLIWNTKADSVELYDLARDPGEFADAAAANAEAAADLKADAKSFLGTQAALKRKLFPQPAAMPLSAEERQKLEAMGYLNRGARVPPAGR